MQVKTCIQMKYMGSKARIAKEIIPIITKNRKENQYFVEPFVGGCNLIDKIDGLRIGNDIHKELISMWKEIVYNGWIPQRVSRETYDKIRKNTQEFDDYFVGFVKFACTYGGKSVQHYMGGFADDYPEYRRLKKTGVLPSYQQEAINGIMRQVPFLKGVIFENKDYEDLYIPRDSIVYCDAPYQGVTTYTNLFDYDRYWNWVRKISLEHEVYVSEYNAPDDFQCIWEKSLKSQLDIGSKLTKEKLFKYVY